MNCKEFETCLLKYYLGEEEDKPKASEYIKMQTHIRSCPNCSVLADKLKGIQAALSGLIKQKCSNNFYDILLEKLPKPSQMGSSLKEINKTISRVPKAVWIGMGVVTAVICIFVLFKMFFVTYGLPVVYYHGDIEIKRNADTAGWVKLKDYTELNNGDKIKTDDSSMAIIAISPTSTIRITEKTELKVLYLYRKKDQYNCKLSLTDGTIWVSDKGTAEQKIQIATDNAFVEPEVAECDISFSDNNKTMVRVFKGNLKFYHKNFTDEKNKVNEGQCSVSSSDQPPTSPINMDTSIPGGWEQWNLNLPLPGDIIKEKEKVKDAVKLPSSYSQTNLFPKTDLTPVPEGTPSSLTPGPEGYNPGNPGTNPGNPGTNPGNPGTNPGNPGNPGTNPGNPGNPGINPGVTPIGP